MARTQPTEGIARRDRNEEDLQQDNRANRPKSKEEAERALDKELADSFPTSDPPSSSQPTRSGPAGDPRVKP